MRYPRPLTKRINRGENMTRKQFLAVVEHHGAILEEERGFKIEVLAPPRKILATTHNHASSIYTDRGWPMAKAYDALADDLKMGWDNCDDPECDWCNDN